MLNRLKKLHAADLIDASSERGQLCFSPASEMMHTIFFARWSSRPRHTGRRSTKSWRLSSHSASVPSTSRMSATSRMSDTFSTSGSKKEENVSTFPWGKFGAWLVFNSLPQDITSCDSISSFCRLLKTFYFRDVFV